METAFLTETEAGRTISFSAMVRNRFADQLLSKLQQHTKLRDIDLQSATLSNVVITSLERDVVYADVLFQCTTGESNRVIRASYVVDCYFDAKDDFSQIHVRCITPSWPTRAAQAVLPDTLVPDIPKDQMETVARSILKDLYPTALRNAIPVSALGIALRLGLRVEHACFDPQGETLGMIFFEDSTTAVYDPIEGMSRILNVKRGTILINQKTDGTFDARVINNTILHECVHWILHKPAYLLQKAYDARLNAIACRRSSAVQRDRTWTAFDRMEWQANALAPRILMPEWSVRMQVDQLIRRMDKLDPKYRVDLIVSKLSAHYAVSRTLARIRMIELGYEDAKLGYIDPVHYEVGFPDAVREYGQNESFRKTLGSGAYAYVDQRFCLRDKRYIARADDGILHLTDYAKAHEAECCLAFDYRRHTGWVPGGMQRDRKQTAKYVEAAVDIQRLTRTTQDLSRVLNGLPGSFGATLEAHMQRRGMTQEQLAEGSLITDRRIRTYCMSDQMVPLPRVVALCIGLKLHPILSLDLVKKAGYLFNQTPEHVAYQMILVAMTHNSIYECNEYLKTLGLKPIGKEE